MGVNMKEDILGILIYSMGGLFIATAAFLIWGGPAFLGFEQNHILGIWIFIPFLCIGLLIMGFARIIDLLNQINQKLKN